MSKRHEQLLARLASSSHEDRVLTIIEDASTLDCIPWAQAELARLRGEAAEWRDKAERRLAHIELRDKQLTNAGERIGALEAQLPHWANIPNLMAARDRIAEMDAEIARLREAAKTLHRHLGYAVATIENVTWQLRCDALTAPPERSAPPSPNKSKPRRSSVCVSTAPATNSTTVARRRRRG